MSCNFIYFVIFVICDFFHIGAQLPSPINDPIFIEKKTFLKAESHLKNSESKMNSDFNHTLFIGK